MALTFEGFEKTVVHYSASEGDKTVSKTAYGSRTLVRINVPVSQSSLFQNGKRIQRGQYQLPFDIETPDSLPASMYFSWGGDSCEVVYKVKAILKGSGVLWNYNCESKVVIKAMPKTVERVPFIARPDTQRIRLLCCLNRGTVSLGAKVDATHLERGTDTAVSIACYNDSTVQVRSITASLVERVEWSADWHNQWCTNKLDIHNFDKSMRGTERQKRPGKTNADLKQIYQDIIDGSNTGSLSLPLTALNSYYGSLITVKHEIVVKITTGCCIDNPTITIPVQVTDSPAVMLVAVPVTNPTDELPEATATLVTTSVLYADSGLAIFEPDIAVTPSPTAPVEPNGPTIGTLLQDMEHCISGEDILMKRIVDPSWHHMFESLRPDDYNKILRGVKSDFDQVKVAVLVARNVAVFTCDHIVQALRAVTDWNRTGITEHLIPLCADFRNNHKKVHNELSDWERIVTERVFADALR